MLELETENNPANESSWFDAHQNRFRLYGDDPVAVVDAERTAREWVLRVADVSTLSHSQMDSTSAYELPNLSLFPSHTTSTAKRVNRLRQKALVSRGNIKRGVVFNYSALVEVVLAGSNVAPVSHDFEVSKTDELGLDLALGDEFGVEFLLRLREFSEISLSEIAEVGDFSRAQFRAVSRLLLEGFIDFEAGKFEITQRGRLYLEKFGI